MNVFSLIPQPDTIPVHWGWFRFLLILTFTLHLIIMNTMLGMGIIALFSHYFNKDEDRFPTKTISRKLPFLIAFAVNSGVGALLFIQVLYGQFIYTSSILMAVYMLVILLLLMVAYYGAYIYDFKFDQLSIQTRHMVIGVIVVCFLIIGFFFSNNMTLMLSPENWLRYFSNASGTLLNLKEPTLIPRYAHVIFASIANAGLFLALMQEKKAAKGDKIALNKQKITMKWYTVALMVNLLVGAWFFVTLPRGIISLFLGKHMYATHLLAIGIVGAVLSLVLGLRNKVKACTLVTLLTLVDMVLIRDLLRQIYIQPYFQVQDLQVSPQYSPMIFFFSILVIGVGLIAYMIKQAVNAGKEEVK